MSGTMATPERFAEAVAAIDAGDVDALRALVESEPSLVAARGTLEPPFDYFTGATLLHYVAGNPDRGRLSGARPPLPSNIGAVARLLLDAGADVHAATLGPSPATTLDLVLTSKQANDAGVSGDLIDVLLAAGASLDLTSSDVLDAPLANHAPRAAEKLLSLGAPLDLLSAAALGRMDWLHDAFDASGRLRLLPRRCGQPLAERDAIGLALLFAYVCGREAAVEFLLGKDLNPDMTGVNNGTALHRAAWNGDRAMAERLMAKGADVNRPDALFGATPLGWACAAEQTEAVRLLLARGADPDRRNASGLTALDTAERQGATAIVTLLAAHGARRGRDLPR